MIPILLRGMVPRLLFVAFVAWVFYLMDQGFHQHGLGDAEPGAAVEPTGLSFTLANLGGLTTIILLAGFVAVDRRRGYYRLFFSHSTNPLAFYGLRWALGVLLALAVVILFYVFGQLAAWGELRVTVHFILHAFLFVLVYSGLIAFLSVVLPRGDALVTFAVFLSTELWLLLVIQLGAQPFVAPVRQAITFLLPPHTALQDVYAGLVVGQVEWGAAAFSAGYGLFWLVVAGLLLRLREWP